MSSIGQRLLERCCLGRLPPPTSDSAGVPHTPLSLPRLPLVDDDLLALAVLLIIFPSLLAAPSLSCLWPPGVFNRGPLSMSLSMNLICSAAGPSSNTMRVIGRQRGGGRGLADRRLGRRGRRRPRGGRQFGRRRGGITEGRRVAVGSLRRRRGARRCGRWRWSPATPSAAAAAAGSRSPAADLLLMLAVGRASATALHDGLAGIGGVASGLRRHSGVHALSSARVLGGSGRRTRMRRRRCCHRWKS